jgi:hypothetical protein
VYITNQNRRGMDIRGRIDNRHNAVDGKDFHASGP